jgi:hypothetical protein
MLVSAIEYREIINSTIYQQTDKKLKKIVLEEEEWACLDDVVQVLCPLKQVTLQVFKKGASLSITNVMMLYHFCTVSLKQTVPLAPANASQVTFKSHNERLAFKNKIASKLRGSNLCL